MSLLHRMSTIMWSTEAMVASTILGGGDGFISTMSKYISSDRSNIFAFVNIAATTVGVALSCISPPFMDRVCLISQCGIYYRYILSQTKINGVYSFSAAPNERLSHP